MASKRSYLTASEIGSYAFCPRAWGLRKLGCFPNDRRALDEGSSFHHRFGIRDRFIRILRVLLILVIIFLAILILRYFLK